MALSSIDKSEHNVLKQWPQLINKSIECIDFDADKKLPWFEVAEVVSKFHIYIEMNCWRVNSKCWEFSTKWKCFARYWVDRRLLFICIADDNGFWYAYRSFVVVCNNSTWYYSYNIVWVLVEPCQKWHIYNKGSILCMCHTLGVSVVRLILLLLFRILLNMNSGINESTRYDEPWFKTN